MFALLFLVVLIVLVVAWAVIALVVALGSRMRFSVTGATGADAKVLRAYARTFSRTLSTLGVSRAARRRHVDELKSNLAEAVAADGVEAALYGLGPAGALATGYADYRPRPAWVVGIVAALGTWLVALLVQSQLAGAYADGWTDGLGLTGGGVFGSGARMNALAVTFEWATRADGINVNVSSPWIWMLPVVAFFVASRAWRVLSLRNAATVSV